MNEEMRSLVTQLPPEVILISRDKAAQLRQGGTFPCPRPPFSTPEVTLRLQDERADQSRGAVPRGGASEALLCQRCGPSLSTCWMLGRD
ncbi:hypothetical protein AAFF_G00251570 [Aldrovandia affinis]|uniref:Uncharacterized protein n=1 Tax=Aldrovandia affinis TaxID=143900 RepID=A0AAD7WTC4_9TELE|nr:hypothetical protein AAFF_G00251570 [Aldrovandia affinis]